MICIIRIKGEVGINRKIEERLYRLRLRRKYSCVVLKSTKEVEGLVKTLGDYVAFGEIDKKTFQKLIEKRGKVIDKKKKIDYEKLFEDAEKGKKLEELNLKPFFRLHPPRRGIKSKIHFPKGALGNHKEKINDLIERML